MKDLYLSTSRILYQRHRSQKRVWFYGFVVVLIVGILLWGQHSVTQVVQAQEAQLQAQAQQLEENMAAQIKNSPLSAIELLKSGVTLINKGMVKSAIPMLQEAIARDQKIRDAHLFLGIAQLRLAEDLWTHDSTLAKSYTQQAIRNLEEARRLDPVNRITFQWLEIAYNNLGQEKLAQDAKRRYEILSSSSN